MLIYFPLLALLLTSCGQIFDLNIKVSLIFDNGEPTKQYTVSTGYALRDFGVPTKTNSVFTGWYRDEDLTEKYYGSRVFSSMTLYAAYSLNQKEIEKKIEEETIYSVFTIEVTNMVKNSNHAYTSQGSGVVFYKEENMYYAFTNNHVVVKPIEYEVTQSISVIDADDSRFTAEKIHELNDFDLAIVKFTSSSNYVIPNIEKMPMKANRDVVAIGSPLGVKNVVTLGKSKMITSAPPGKETYLSNIDFPVIVHTAKIDNGSSGGPLFDYKLDLVGINYATGTLNKREVSLSIPVDKMLEYIDIAKEEVGATLDGLILL